MFHTPFYCFIRRSDKQLETASFQPEKLLALKPFIKLSMGSLPQYHLLKLFLLSVLFELIVYVEYAKNKLSHAASIYLKND